MIIESEKDKTNYHYSSYTKYKKYDDDDDEDESKPRLSKKFIDKLLCSDVRQYYRTHELNDILYIHFKGFRKIENLETFTNLKVLYLEGNSISKISGLENLVNLTSLYLHENVIDKIEGLDTLVNLYNLNLSDNCISTIENLGKLPQLSTLLLKRNRIGIHGLCDLQGLLELQGNFTVLDISNNQIVENEVVNEVISKVPNLRVLYMSGNECVRKIANYRKTLIALLKELRYIDDKPVFEDERRFAMAFHRGGYEEERKERALYKKEMEDKELKRLDDFREMMSKWKKEGEDANANANETNTKQIEEEKKTLTPEEREKQKLALLAKCKNKKKNEIFTENEVERFPEVKRGDGNKNIEDEDKDKQKEKENDAIPELEEVKFKLQQNPYIEESKEDESNSNSKTDESNKNKENNNKNNINELDKLD